MREGVKGEKVERGKGKGGVRLKGKKSGGMGGG